MRPPDLEHCPSRPDALAVLQSRANASLDDGNMSAILDATQYEYGWPGLCLLALLQARVMIARWGQQAVLALDPGPSVAWYVSVVARDMHGVLSPDELAPEDLFHAFGSWGRQLVDVLARIGRRLRELAVPGMSAPPTQ